MRHRLFALFACLAALAIEALGAEGPAEDPLAPWRNAAVRPVSEAPDRHTIHSYYLTSPESPDGTRVVFYASAAPDGHRGEIRVLDRATGEQTAVARSVEIEDAHRAACQQWTAAGRLVAFHDVRGGKWGVYTVDLQTRQEHAVAPNRQLSFGAPSGSLLPVYGCHWNPGEHRDLELVDAVSGKARTYLQADDLKQNHGAWLEKQFSGRPISIFFPIVSPDQKRVFFKIAGGSGGKEFRTSGASKREGLFVYDLEQRRMLMMRERWGHPAWTPDSRQVIEVGNLLFDVSQAKQTRIPDLPSPGGCHMAVSPGGKLFVMDGRIDQLGGKPGEWGIVVCDIRGGKGRYCILHAMNNSGGARSWRKSHPHPVFSADGKRIYFNVNDTAWTRLYVAECAAAGAAGS